MSLTEIAGSANEGNVSSPEIMLGITASLLVLLDVFGVLKWQGAACQLASQIPAYFRNSLVWYVTHNQKIFSNWKSAGTAGEIDKELIQEAPYFLKAMELKRLSLSGENKIEPGYSRLQGVAFNLITVTSDGTQYFLHQWDERAQQYQLIGGRQRPDEPPLETAKRELEEELSNNQLSYGRDYELSPLNSEPIEISEVSRTYGALTRYNFWLFAVTLASKQLHLGEGDKWISWKEMINGTTEDGTRVGDADFYKLIDTHIPGGLSKIPPSVSPEQIEDQSSS